VGGGCLSEPAEQCGQDLFLLARATGIARRSRGGPAVMVNREAVNRQLLAPFDAGLGDPGTIPQDNGCFNTLQLRGGSWAVLAANELPAGP
jgi:hypothetical protein